MKATIYNNSVHLSEIKPLQYLEIKSLLEYQMGVKDFTTEMRRNHITGAIKAVKVPYIATVYDVLMEDRLSVVISRTQLTHVSNHIQLNCPDATGDTSSANLLGTQTPAKANIHLAPEWSLREMQQDVVSWADNIKNSDASMVKTALVDLPTGEGKTVTCVGLMDKYKERTLMVLQPRLVDKWVEDLLEGKKPLIDPNKGTTFAIIRSGVALVDLMNRAANGDPIEDVVIISNVIMRNYINAYIGQDTGDDVTYNYPITPVDFAPACGFGLLVVDEVHENFHFNFVMSLFMNVSLYIGLSATLVSDQSVVQGAMNTMFPVSNRYGKVKPKKHAIAINGTYLLKNPNKFRSVVTARGYNHIKFEQIFTKNKFLLKQYFEMFKYWIDELYIKDYQPGDKCLLYIASNDMADALFSYIKQTYPDKTCKTYVRKDPYENVIKPDIRISSPLKCKSAVDIPGLTTIIMSNNISSIGANVQMLGRGRQLENRSVHFCYLSALNAPKHLAYADAKRKLLVDLVKEHVTKRYPFNIG